MVKVTPDPPTDSPSPHNTSDPIRPQLAASIMAAPHNPSPFFTVNPELDTATLLVYACESLASASVMSTDLADHLQGTPRNALLGIAQVIMLGELAVNRALDQLDPQ
ncbi:hypothetical protein ASE98_07680 [Pseudomonas sp. Leaf48]|jgi:hypothetical protein|uniref:DUF6124 family protein n=1 Tax=Pseudomonas sp. Leaf48 TaxID=1736221 RepID=UPI0007247DBC|nr:DUF6124 family protein [Pseudomonas sp. Leaf48]KQN44813.1 hypothetical protein ASE98_07680 [Pseudomonas sp. Leaf48]